MKKSLVIFSLFLCVPAHAVILLQGNGTSPQTFNQIVGSKVFDRSSGVFYVGLGQTGGGATAVAKINRSGIQSAAHTFTNIGSNTILSGRNIVTLALATTPGSTNPIIVGSASTSNSGIATTTFAMTTTGGTVIQSPVLLDASGGLDSNGKATNGVEPSIAANSEYQFIPVAPNAGPFGSTNSGIAVIHIDQTTNLGTPRLAQLVQTAAQAGDAGIKAKRLDPSTSQVMIQDQPTIADGAELYFDYPLNRLYIGIEAQTATNVGSGAKSVVVGRETNGVLEFANIAPDGAFVAGQYDRMVGVINADFGVSQTVAASTLRVMHTSTGPTYLIVNGGDGLVDCGSTFTFTTTTLVSDAGNELYALPLVDDPSSPLVHGTLAKKDAPLEVKDASLGTFRFVTPATANADLPINSEAPVRIGGGPFPISSEHCISDLVVVGDTVFASSDITQSDNDESGIFYSQAMFDEDGKIVRWTPWAKRAFPFDAIPDPMAGRITFFDVDALTGNIIAIGDGGKTVGVTRWDFGTDSVSLTSTLNEQMSDGVYSVLDLDQATRCLGALTPTRYALFGGPASVAFALTSSSRAPSAPYDINPATDVPYPQLVTEDYSLPENFRMTTLPGNAGCVTSLEFARTCTGDGITNYFFAGTRSGLYVFTDPDGDGLDVTTFGALDEPPFSNGIWQKAPNINGSIVDIKSGGFALYVLTFETSRSAPLQNKLYKIPFTANLATMFDESNITLLAQTKTNPIFGKTTLFTGIEIIKTGANPSAVDEKEQLVLTTNTGLYISDANQAGADGIIDATNQTTANWQLFANTGGTMFSNVFGIDTPLPATVWPVSIQDLQGFKTWTRSTIHQLSGNGNTAGTTALFNADFIPAQFNGSSNTAPFITLPSISYFFSDGARRMAITSASGCDVALGNKILTLPWSIQEWNANQPAQQLLFTPPLRSQTTLFWLKQIGATGILMAGTSKGVLSLE